MSCAIHRLAAEYPSCCINDLRAKLAKVEQEMDEWRFLAQDRDQTIERVEAECDSLHQLLDAANTRMRELEAALVDAARLGCSCEF